MNDRAKRVADLCDGLRTSRQIAEILGERHKYVQEVFLKYDLPRRKRGSAFGNLNGSFAGGRKIDRDGYVIVSAPVGHPYARIRKNRNTGIILEHRLLMEKKIGRFLFPEETVDHIDGLRLHNHIDNLRLFENNGQHLHETLAGQIPNWSRLGYLELCKPTHHRKLKQVDTYSTMKKSGDARLIQILRCALALGINSPYLLGTRHHLEKAQIFDYSRTSLEHELGQLYHKYE